jgi:hypothetical protein
VTLNQLIKIIVQSTYFYKSTSKIMEKKMTDRGSGAIKLASRSVRLAALAATVYFFFGPEGKKHREGVKSWAAKMKEDVLKKIETAHEISEFAYHKMIDSVAARHEKGNKAAPEEIKALADDLKKHWKKIDASAKVVKDNVVEAVKKVVNKNAKKIVKKTAVKSDNKNVKSKVVKKK